MIMRREIYKFRTRLSQTIFARRHLNYEQVLTLFMIILSVYVIIQKPGLFAFAFLIFSLLVPVVFRFPKTFFLIIITSKMVINGMYDVKFLGNISILKLIGGFVPIFLIVYMAVRKVNTENYPFRQLILLFVGEVMLGFTFTIYGERSFGEVDKLLRFLNGVTCYFAMPLLFNTEKDTKLFLKAWFISVSFPLLIGVYQIFTKQLNFQVQGELGLQRIAGVYHDVGSMIFSCTIFILILFFYHKKFKGGINSLIFYLLLGLNSLLIYRTYSKSAAITLVVILILFTIYSKRKILLFFVSVVIFGIFFSESSGVYKRIQFDLEVREKFGEYGETLMFTGRVGIWERNWNRYLSYKPLQKLIGYSTAGAHNDFLRVLLDNGFLGLILYIAILAAIFIKLFNFLRLETDEFYKNLLFIALLSQVSFILTCFGTTPSLYTDYQWFHWGLVGIALTQVKNRQNNKAGSIGNVE